MRAGSCNVRRGPPVAATRDGEKPMNVIASQFGATRSGGTSGTTGEVILSVGEGLVLVECGAVRMQARRAVSCLIEPEAGDSVLLGGEADRLFVLAVLERRGDAPLRIVLSGDTEIHAARGRLSLSGEEGLALSSAAKVEITAPEVSVIGRAARFVLNEVTHVGRSLTSHVSRLKVVGETLDTMMQQVMSRAKRCFRVVDETDLLRSGEIDYRSDGTLHLRGQNAIVTATTIAKVDAGQIHLG